VRAAHTGDGGHQVEVAASAAWRTVKQTANEGQTANYSRIRSDVFGIVRVATTPGVRNVSFGYTFRQFGAPKTMQWFDQRPGLGGRYFAKIAVSDDYKVVASDAGYLIVSPIG
jgi:hypothetical protein